MQNRLCSHNLCCDECLEKMEEKACEECVKEQL